MMTPETLPVDGDTNHWGVMQTRELTDPAKPQRRNATVERKDDRVTPLTQDADVRRNTRDTVAGASDCAPRYA